MKSSKELGKVDWKLEKLRSILWRAENHLLFRNNGFRPIFFMLFFRCYHNISFLYFEIALLFDALMYIQY